MLQVQKSPKSSQIFSGVIAIIQDIKKGIQILSVTHSEV